MLNELYQVYQGLVSHNISLPQSWHRNMMSPPKHQAHAVIFLNEKGEVTSTEFGNGSFAHWDDTSLMRAFEISGSGQKSGGRFPVLVPQYTERAKSAVSTAEKLRKKGAITKAEADLQKKEARLVAFAEVFRLKATLLREERIPDLEKRIRGSEQYSEDLHDCLTLMVAVTQFDLDDLVINLAVLDEKVSEKIQEGKSVLIAFELDNASGTSNYPINHSKTIGKINQTLFDHDNKDQLPNQEVIFSADRAIDAFGNSIHNYSDGFKTIKIKNFSDIYPRSLNTKAIDSFIRWGEKDYELCRLGEESKGNIAGALEWITAPSLEEKTWRSLQRVTGQKELLIAFSEGQVNPDDVSFLDMLTPKTEVVMEGDYAESTAVLIKALDGLSPEAKQKNLSFFSIRNTSNNTAGVHHYGTFMVDSLVNFAKEWELASQNLPLLMVYDGANEQKMQSPFPAEVVPLINKASKDSSAKKEPRLITLSDAFYLFSGHQSQQQAVAERLFRLLIDGPFRQILQHSSYYRSWYPQSSLNKGKFSKESHKFMLRLPVLLAIGLYKINIFKEQYMTNLPFLIGQYLALIDEAHLIHYQVQNQGKTPSTLIGSRSLSTALENPIQALSGSGQRALIYIEWIKTKATAADEEGKRLANLRFRIEKNAQQLAEQILPEGFSETEKAQLIIGYLAGSTSKNPEA